MIGCNMISTVILGLYLLHIVSKIVGEMQRATVIYIYRC